MNEFAVKLAIVMPKTGPSGVPMDQNPTPTMPKLGPSGGPMDQNPTPTPPATPPPAMSQAPPPPGPASPPTPGPGGASIPYTSSGGTKMRGSPSYLAQNPQDGLSAFKANPVTGPAMQGAKGLYDQYQSGKAPGMAGGGQQDGLPLTEAQTGQPPPPIPAAAGPEQPTGPTGGDDQLDAVAPNTPGGAATGDGTEAPPPDAAQKPHMLDFIFKRLGLGGMPNWGKTAGGVGGGMMLLMLLSKLFGKRGSVEAYTNAERRQAGDLMDRMMKQAIGSPLASKPFPQGFDISGVDAGPTYKPSPTNWASGRKMAPRSSRAGRGSRPDQKYVPGHQYQGSRSKPMPSVRTSGADKAIDKMGAFRVLVKHSKIGPYDVQQSSDVAHWDDVIASITRNRKERPGHYWANPFVPGPIRELGARYARRANAGTVENLPGAIGGALTGGIIPAIMGGLEAKNQARDIYEEYAAPYSNEIDDDAAAKEKEGKYESDGTGPFSGAMAGMTAGADKAIAGTEYARKNNPGQYWLNPFVSGPISELLQRFSRRSLAGTGRNMSGAAMGATLPVLGQLAGGATGIPGGQSVGQLIGMVPTAGMGGLATRNKARESHKAVNMPYHEAAGDKRTQERVEQGRKSRSDSRKPKRDGDGDGQVNDEEKAASFAEKLAMKPLMVMQIRRQKITMAPSGKKGTKSPSVRPSDNKTPSTNDMAKSKDCKGAFTVTS